jgi:hypothetical protein
VHYFYIHLVQLDTLSGSIEYGVDAAAVLVGQVLLKILRIREDSQTLQALPLADLRRLAVKTTHPNHQIFAIFFFNCLFVFVLFILFLRHQLISV